MQHEGRSAAVVRDRSTASPVATASVLVACAGLVGFLYLRRTHQRSADIRQAITAFAAACDAADAETMMSMMCAEEAAEFADGLEGSDLGEPSYASELPIVYVENIKVRGDHASADITRPPTPTVTLKLKREQGSWRMCNPWGETVT